MKNTTLLLLFTFTLFFNTMHAQWQSMNGPQGRYVRSILCTDSLYYAATGGGVMVSSDKGFNWEFRNNGLTSCDTKCLVTYNDTVFRQLCAPCKAVSFPDAETTENGT